MWKESNAPARPPTLRRNKSQSEAFFASATQTSISESKKCSENPMAWLFSSKTKWQSRPLWPSSRSNWNRTRSQAGLRRPPTAVFLPVDGDHTIAALERFTLTAVTKSSWISRKAFRSSSGKVASHPPRGQTEKRLSLASGRSSSSSNLIKSWWAWPRKVLKRRCYKLSQLTNRSWC